MGKFRSYADRVNKIATEAFAAYQAAEAELSRAESKAREYPQRTGGSVTPDYLARSARAQADLLAAREAVHTAQMRLNSCSAEFSPIRRELAAALQAEYCARPDEVDTATVELLKTGILGASEYETLYSKATNTTMQRLIRHYAGQAAESAAAKYGDSDQRARDLRAVSFYDKDDAGERLEAV